MSDPLDAITIEPLPIPVMEWQLFKVLFKRYQKLKGNEKALFAFQVHVDNKTVH